MVTGTQLRPRTWRAKRKVEDPGDVRLKGRIGKAAATALAGLVTRRLTEMCGRNEQTRGTTTIAVNVETDGGQEARGTWTGRQGRARRTGSWRLTWDASRRNGELELTAKRVEDTELARRARYGRLVEREGAILAVTENIATAMQEEGRSADDVADSAGIERGRLREQMEDGSELTLGELVRIAETLDLKVGLRKKGAGAGDRRPVAR